MYSSITCIGCHIYPNAIKLIELAQQKVIDLLDMKLQVEVRVWKGVQSRVILLPLYQSIY